MPKRSIGSAPRNCGRCRCQRRERPPAPQLCESKRAVEAVVIEPVESPDVTIHSDSARGAEVDGASRGCCAGSRACERNSSRAPEAVEDLRDVADGEVVPA